MKELAALPAAASASEKASPVFVGTEHPVLVNPASLHTTSSKHESPNPVTAPAPQPSVIAGKNSPREVQPSWNAAREQEERMREQAERERAHVEDLYQRHLISKEAYEKGQAEYQHEIAEYEDQIARYSR